MERVLLVDDEPQVLVALEDLLSDEFIVLKTESPERALNLVEQDHDIAVVISDERMPKMPGGELFARIRDSSNARRILVTGFADLSAVIRAVNDGKIFAYVTKPWDSEDLKQKVHQAADQFRLVQEVTSEHKLLQDLMNNTPDGIYFKDRQLRIRGANGSFASLLGADNSEALVGKTIEDVKPDLPHLAASRQEEEAILATGKASIDVVRDHSQPDRKRWISESKAPIRGPESAVLGIVGIARDVTERVLMEETLRESEARLSQQSRLLNTILNSMREAVVAANAQGEFVLFNRRAEALFGGRPTGVDALEWARAQEVALADEAVRLEHDRNPLVQAMLGTHTEETEVSIRNANPTGATLAVTGTPLRDEQGRLIGGLALLRDVTQQRLLERQLAQAQKMEALGRLAGGVAHDFNNLLSVIMSYTDFVQRGLPEGDESRDDLNEVLAATQRASVLTRQLLAISRHKAVIHQVLQLNDVVSNLERMLERVIGEDITLVTRLSSSLALIKADAGQLEQVLLNLTVNARDAMPKGGKLVFATENVRVDAAHPATFVGVPQGRYAMLSVTDTGVGMSQETLGRIFEPFFTTKEVGKGTGLGLATVYGIVQQCGGYLHVESVLCRGTSFQIYFPVVHGSVAPALASKGQSKAPGSATAATVLLVEDDDSVRTVSSRILTARGHTVHQVKLPSEALRLCNERGSDIDLLLTDLVLPEMSGVDLARNLMRQCPRLKILFMSGHAANASIDEELFEAQVEYIQKPFSPYSLAEKVREILEAEP